MKQVKLVVAINYKCPKCNRGHSDRAERDWYVVQDKTCNWCGVELWATEQYGVVNVPEETRPGAKSTVVIENPRDEKPPENKEEPREAKKPPIAGTTVIEIDTSDGSTKRTETKKGATVEEAKKEEPEQKQAGTT